MDTVDEVLEYAQESLTAANTRLKDAAASDDKIMIAYLEGMILSLEDIIERVNYAR